MAAHGASSNPYRERRYLVGKFFCDLCSTAFPVDHMRVQSGLRVGVMCCYESDGGELERDNRRATASIIAARLSAKELTPPMHNGEYYPGAPDICMTQSGVSGISPSPVVLIRGGAAVAVTVTGFGFLAADTFTYGAAGITDNSAPSLASATEWDLSVHASGAMAAGLYSLTYNTTALWQAVFDVR